MHSHTTRPHYLHDSTVPWMYSYEHVVPLHEATGPERALHG